MQMNTTFRRLSDDQVSRWNTLDFIYRHPSWRVALAVVTAILALKVVTK
jgi:hypothetical protein